jgi:hypothetical protein
MASTFAIRTKATHKPKIAKELALFATHLDTFYYFETIDKQMINKKTQHTTNGIANKGFSGMPSAVARLKVYNGG